MKKILFAASECVPFMKTGGLADVVGALPKMFNKDEFDIRVIIPNYTCIPHEFRNNFQYVHHFYMDMGQLNFRPHVGIMTYEFEGITYYFVDNEDYFKNDKPYSTTLYDIEKFTFFSKAVLAILPVIDFKPDIIHCHDWQTGLIPVFLKTLYKDNPFFWGTKTVMTIHNLKFQGIWDIKTFKKFTNLPSSIFTPDKLEYKKDANMLKGGIVYADYITTVSNTYAYEIQTPAYGEGLHGLLKARHLQLRGILNGIDYRLYDPANDSDIFENYTVDDFAEKKAENKLKLQEELGLPQDKNKFMIGLISRLTDQKGLDLVNSVIENIADEFTQFVIIGTGEERYENTFRHYQWKHPDRISSNIFFSEQRAHRLYAAADAMLVPSRFEPCGLTQLMSLRYGTVPIVRETGGLKDTVIPYNEFENYGTGFSFTNYNAGDMLNVINYAKSVYFNNRDNWNQIVKRGMTSDFSWGSSALQYAGMYKWLAP